MQLLLIGQVLPLAAAADPEMAAKGRRIGRRLLQHLHHPAFGKLRFFPGNPHPHPLPWEGMLHEDHQAVQPAQGLAAEGQLVDPELDLGSFGEAGELG